MREWLFVIVVLSLLLLIAALIGDSARGALTDALAPIFNEVRR